RTAEVDLHLVGVDAIDGEALAGQPRGDRGDISVAHAEAGAELLWSDPLMELARRRVVLCGNQRIECGGALRAALEHQLHMVHWGGIGDSRGGLRCGKKG